MKKVIFMCFIILFVYGLVSQGIQLDFKKDYALTSEKKGKFDNIDPNVKYYASIFGKKVSIYDLETDILMNNYKHDDFVNCVAYTSDSKFIALGGSRNIDIFFIETGTLVKHFDLDNTIDFIKFNPQNNIISFISNYEFYQYKYKRKDNALTKFYFFLGFPLKLKSAILDFDFQAMGKK